ncbi:MAG: hypothetical protein IPP80_10475 [Ignavibacteria bacterium]|nr:hypothetical protein [Ignavibacteria bacterium]
MKRRTFLRNSASAAALPVLWNGLPVTAFGRSAPDALDAAPCEDRVLVLMQLNGGNDGLNTLILLDQYAEYTAARSNIAIEEAKVLKLTNEAGLHPQMTGLADASQWPRTCSAGRWISNAELLALPINGHLAFSLGLRRSDQHGLDGEISRTRLSRLPPWLPQCIYA